MKNKSMLNIKKLLSLCLVLCLLFCASCGRERLELRYEELSPRISTIRDWNLAVENGWQELLTREEAAELCGNLSLDGLELPGMAYREEQEETTVFYDGNGRVLNYWVLCDTYEDAAVNGRIVDGLLRYYSLTIGLRPCAMAMSEEIQRFREQEGSTMEAARKEPVPNATLGKRPAAAFHAQHYLGTDPQTEEAAYADVYSVSFMEGETGLCVTSVGLSREEFETCLSLVLKKLG